MTDLSTGRDALTLAQGHLYCWALHMILKFIYNLSFLLAKTKQKKSITCNFFHRSDVNCALQEQGNHQYFYKRKLKFKGWKYSTYAIHKHINRQGFYWIYWKIHCNCFPRFHLAFLQVHSLLFSCSALSKLKQISLYSRSVKAVLFWPVAIKKWEDKQSIFFSKLLKTALIKIGVK